MTSFIKTSAAFTQRDAKNATPLGNASVFSVAKRFLASATSSCVQANVGQPIDHKHSKSANVAACHLGLSRTFRVGSAHTLARAKRKQQGGSASLWPRQRQGVRSGGLHMQLIQAAWLDRTSASNAGLKEKQKAHILTTNDRLMSGGYADHVMCAGMRHNRKAAVFLSQYDFTGQTYDELKAEREAA